MAYKSRAYDLPRLPAHAPQAWALHDRLAKQAEDDQRAERERKAAVDAANQANAAADQAGAENAVSKPRRHGVSAHFD